MKHLKRQTLSIESKSGIPIATKSHKLVAAKFREIPVEDFFRNPQKFT